MFLFTANREDNGKYYYPKSKLEDIYKQIIADMRYAYENPTANNDRTWASYQTGGRAFSCQALS
jgi:hypothetical protein